MKELRGSASETVERPIEDCFALLADVERYPAWYPEVVRALAIVSPDAAGHPARAETTLHLAHGPLVRDFHLLLAIRLEHPSYVVLERIPHGSSDGEEFEVSWRLEERGETRIELELNAKLSVPRLVPLGGLADAFAAGFVRAAVQTLS
jgi:ribosome-associated toxin RatA of RatAB toxin-antitoxin module